MAGMPESAKGIINWVLVAGIIAFVLLIFGIIFGNLSGNLGWSQDTSTFYNETISLTDAGATPAGAQNRVDPSISSYTLINATGGETIGTANYTLDGILFKNLTSEYGSETGNVKVTYTISYDSDGDIDTQDIILNYTQAGVNTATQLPTVGTITGIVLLIIILLSALIFVIMKLMGIAEGTSNVKKSNIKTDFGSPNGNF